MCCAGGQRPIIVLDAVRRVKRGGYGPGAGDPDPLLPPPTHWDRGATGGLGARRQVTSLLVLPCANAVQGGGSGSAGRHAMRVSQILPLVSAARLLRHLKRDVFAAWLYMVTQLPTGMAQIPTKMAQIPTKMAPRWRGKIFVWA